jgi:integrase
MTTKVRKGRTGRIGYEVDIRATTTDGRSIRERVQSPVSTREGSKRWAQQRELHLALEHGFGGCRCRATGKEGEALDLRMMTVNDAVQAWLAQREKEGVPSVKSETQRLEQYVLPAFGKMLVLEWRPKTTVALVKHLKALPSKQGGSLASRTVRKAYFSVRQVFQSLVLDEVLVGNPIFAHKGLLPAVTDKNPGWRSTAVFTAAEVEQLLSDDRIAVHRRVAYAIEFLTGLRTGQVSALTWGDYEGSIEPLGRLTSAWSWDSKGKVLKATKTKVTHQVPVHPALAKVLAAWKLTGWQARMKRKPTDKDLIVPTINNTHRDVRKALEDFHEDLERLSLRKRRQYDARRTFISLGLDGGASKDLLQSITHPRPADAFDLYRTHAWAAKCEAVKQVKVQLREGTVLRLPTPATPAGRGALGEHAADERVG